ncbi:unnamed protein product [Parnassius apollo]|uniref:(apollo) hypothetical protein n=1 Tax=Parnassius apollo TaxID=110799 RepID=A0A8S3X675_PARAO|nr:unnamed protein product [Parnassius apollo]
MEEEEFQGVFEKRKRQKANIFTNDYDLIKPMDIDTEEKKYYIRNILPTNSQGVSDGTVPVQQFTLTRSTILKAIEEQAKQNTSLADKYLDVVIRNFHGEFNIVPPTSYHEKLINGVLEKWEYCHMKFHGKYVKKIWSARMLLPLKCVTGEIVECATIINVPKNNLAIFMNGLEDEKIIQIMSDSDDDIINLDEGNEADESDLNTLQAQLDAEIEKDIEMEAAISNVFKSSKCYQRFLEKENEEPVEEYQFSSDRGMIGKPDVTTVMLDTDSDDDSVNGESE